MFLLPADVGDEELGYVMFHDNDYVEINSFVVNTITKFKKNQKKCCSFLFLFLVQSLRDFDSQLMLVMRAR